MIVQVLPLCTPIIKNLVRGGKGDIIIYNDIYKIIIIFSVKHHTPLPPPQDTHMSSTYH